MKRKEKNVKIWIYEASAWQWRYVNEEFSVMYVTGDRMSLCFYVLDSVSGASGDPSHPRSGRGSADLSRELLVYSLHPQAAPQQSLHPPRHHLR